MTSSDHIASILRKYRSELLSVEGVTGIGQGVKDEQEVIVVFITDDDPDIRSRIPKSLDGIPVDIRFSGAFSAGM